MKAEIEVFEWYPVYSLDIDYGGNIVDIPDDELMNMRRAFAEFEAIQKRLKKLYESA